MSSTEAAPRRCRWVERAGALDVAYHDTEWGVPRVDDETLFEALTLEGAQAGLSWSTILKKREGYRQSFLNFNPSAVSGMTSAKVETLLTNPEIVRHRGKIESTVNNAARVLDVQAEFGSFAKYVWGFVAGAPVQNEWASLEALPATTAASTLLSKDLKKRGFRFVGPTTCYAFMQAVGLVNDHEIGCFRHAEVRGLGEGLRVP